MFLYPWQTSEGIGVADECVHKRRREARGRFVYHEMSLWASSACLDLAFFSSLWRTAAALVALEDYHLSSPFGLVIVTAPKNVHDSKISWDFGDLPAHLSHLSLGHEQCHTVLAINHKLVLRAWIQTPDNTLQVLDLFDDISFSAVASFTQF